VNVKVDESFEKDTDKIADAKLLLKIADIIEQVRKAQSFADIPNLKKLKGFKNYYRIRIGDYRAGITIENRNVAFERLLHRKDIYRYYP
jgi:mRNA interferase RelE/StbE